MTIRQACMYMVMASGLFLVTGGMAFADQSMGGDKHRSDQSKGDKPGHAGGDAMKQGQSGNTGVDPYGQPGAPKTGGEATLGGSGRIPDSSTTNPGKGSTGGNSSGMGSGAGSMGSPGGAGGK